MDESIMLPFLTRLAKAARDVILPYYRSADLQVEAKADATPVTEADRGAERELRRLINETYPHHGIIGEEYGEENADADYVWVLDPVDGTKTFAHGLPLFGTLIALTYQGEPIWGANCQPFLDHLAIGNNEKAWFNGQPVKMRETTELARATLLTTDPLRPADHKDGARFEQLARSVAHYRSWGDAYGYLMVATGWADIMTDPVVAPWDYLASVPIIRGAGGIVTDWEGRDPARATSCVAANRHLHPLVMEILNG